MPRLLILCEYPTLLGGERSMLATLGPVAAAGFEVQVAAPPSGPLAETLLSLPVKPIFWRTHDESGSRLPLEQLRVELDWMITATRPDLIHANSLSTSRIAGPVAAGRGIASIGHLRDIVKLSDQAVIDVNAHRWLIAVSRAARDFHVHQGIDATRCSVLYNGVDLDQFQPRPATGQLHAALQLPANTRLVATVGQLGLRKGTDVALSAAWQLAADWPDLHWLVVGERTSQKDEAREFEELVREIAAEPPLAGRVHFLGMCDDIASILCECELLVHAARQEPLGRVLLEAAACGLAIVATDVGGTREIFPAEADGAVLVPPDQRAALVEAIAGLLASDERRRKLGTAARRRMEQTFDIRDAAARLIQRYHAVLTAGG